MLDEGQTWAGRRYGWRAVYTDGLTLDELAAGGAARFEDVARERLARFSLVEGPWGPEVVGLDCCTGVFTVRGRHVEFRLGDLRLTGHPRGYYRDVLQFKSAHADWREEGGSSGTVVDAYHLGYRVVLPEGAFEVVLCVEARTGRVGIMFELFPVAGRTPPTGELAVLVDGVRVDSFEEFEGALENLAGEELETDCEGPPRAERRASASRGEG